MKTNQFTCFGSSQDIINSSSRLHLLLHLPISKAFGRIPSGSTTLNVLQRITILEGFQRRVDEVLRDVA